MSYNRDKVLLNNGKQIPTIGFGTSMINGEKCINAVKTALEVGYKHIDTAYSYKNEYEVGNAIKQSDIKREDIFITSKVWKDSMGFDKTIESFNNSLNNLGLEYLDLFLIHWPKSDNDQLNIETWNALEYLYKKGKVKSIGVSNFLKNHLEVIIQNCEVIPAVNQIEFHPGLMRKETIEYCRENKIVIEGWAPLGKGKMLKNEKLNMIAKKYNKSVAQICLKWCLQNEIIPLPKSENRDRMKQNLDLFDFELSNKDVDEINEMEYFAGSNMDPKTFN